MLASKDPPVIVGICKQNYIKSERSEARNQAGYEIARINIRGRYT